MIEIDTHIDERLLESEAVGEVFQSILDICSQEVWRRKGYILPDNAESVWSGLVVGAKRWLRISTVWKEKQKICKEITDFMYYEADGVPYLYPLDQVGETDEDYISYELSEIENGRVIDMMAYVAGKIAVNN